MSNQNNQQKNNKEVDPTVEKAGRVVGIILLAAAVAVVLSLVYKLIEWIITL